MINLGDTVRDAVSGFQGVVTSKTEFLNGCMRVGVQPPVDKDGKLPDEKWFDIDQMEFVSARTLSKKLVQTGGPTSSDIPNGLRR